MPSTNRNEDLFSLMARKGLSKGPKTSRSDAIGPLDLGVPEVILRQPVDDLKETVVLNDDDSSM